MMVLPQMFPSLGGRLIRAATFRFLKRVARVATTEPERSRRSRPRGCTASDLAHGLEGDLPRVEGHPRSRSACMIRSISVICGETSHRAMRPPVSWKRVPSWLMLSIISLPK